MKCVVSVFIAVIVFCITASNGKFVVCYYGTWATYRWNLGKFDVENINAELCTHLMYAFAGIDKKGSIVPLDPHLDLPDNWGRDNFGKFNALKQKNPNLKTILAVGGWGEGSAKYSTMAANPEFRKNFINTGKKLILDHGFDGLDIDWEYPNLRDTVYGKDDIDNFTQLLKELKEEFNKYGLLLTAAVAATGQMASQSYDIPGISKYLDIINLMTYDMYGAWDSVTGHNSPLHRGLGDEMIDKEIYTVDSALEYWIKQGCPPEKLVIGLPLYGRTFILKDPEVNAVRSLSTGAGIGGPYTATDGMIGFNELCAKLKSERWDIHFDNLAKVPYATQGRNWVSYDDVDSLKAKVEYGMKHNVAGFMVWSIETDDFYGTCHNEDFPLLKAINSAMGRIVDEKDVDATTKMASSSTTIATTAILPTTTSKATTSEEDKSSICKEEEKVADPKDCGYFYVCVRNKKGELEAKMFKCPSGLYWDQSIHSCNYSNLVKCDLKR